MERRRRSVGLLSAQTDRAGGRERWHSMATVTIRQIEQQLQQLSPEQLASVFDFVSYLAERRLSSSPLSTMLASEAVLRRDWDRPEEDAAWADLSVRSQESG